MANNVEINKARKCKELLGMPIGTAKARLHKNIMFSLAKKLNLHYCFRCNAEITCSEHLSVEHKVLWKRSTDPQHYFFDLENIAFSHYDCNRKASYVKKYGTKAEQCREKYKRNRDNIRAYRKIRRQRRKEAGLPIQ
jgi:hypothetical protein